MKMLFCLLASMILFQSAGFAEEITPQAIQSIKKNMTEGQIYYVNSDKLNLRSSPTTYVNNIQGALIMNDKVKLIQLHIDGDTRFVKIMPMSGPLSGQAFFAAVAFLQANAPYNAESNSKYFIVQNIASERTRVYERCTETPDCAHRMIMQAEMVVGKDDDGDRPLQFLTWVGRYKITRWVKFYEDSSSHYPSWYHPEYPRLPRPGADRTDWFDSDVMPNKEGKARGAFGWYTATIGPNANEQWLHGTYGWGADRDEFIRATRGFWANLFADPRSSGCTRLENGATAYLQSILPVGTELIRVYAQEGYRDPNLLAYQNQRTTMPWDYILTTEGVQSANAAPSDRNSVLARGVPNSQIIETGRYQVVRYPYALVFKNEATDKERRKGKSGNTYGIPDNQFQGAFLVDIGRFVNYKHPLGKKIMKGGFPGPLPATYTTTGPYKVIHRSR